MAKRWTKDSIRIACVGLENQTEPDPDMPLRNFAYDGAEYKMQVRMPRSVPRYPVVTLVLYFGHTKHWNKPLTLHEAVGVSERFRPFVPDYRINLFEIAWLDRETVAKFRSDFRVVAECFVQMRLKDDNFQPTQTDVEHMQEVLQLLSVMTGDHRYEVLFTKSELEGGTIPVCEMYDRIEAKGVAKGEARGEARGKAEGMAMGKAEGMETERISNIRSLMDNLKFSSKQAMDALNIPASEQSKYEAKL